MKMFWLGTVVGALFLILLMCAGYTAYTLIKRNEERQSEYAMALDSFTDILGGSLNKILDTMQKQVDDSIGNALRDLFETNCTDNTVELTDEEAEQIMLYSRPDAIKTTGLDEDLVKEFEAVGYDIDDTIVIPNK